MRRYRREWTNHGRKFGAAVTVAQREPCASIAPVRVTPELIPNVSRTSPRYIPCRDHRPSRYQSGALILSICAIYPHPYETNV